MTNETDTSRGTVRAMGRALGVAARLARRSRGPAHSRRRPGAPPGIERAPDVDRPPPAGEVTIRCIDYGPELVRSVVLGLDELFARERPPGSKVRWINVDGLHPYVINRLKERYGFHTLAAEDALHVPQRAKQEAYDDHLFVVAHMVTRDGSVLMDEQVSAVLFSDTVITFQERSGDVWEQLRRRIDTDGSRLRAGSASYLLYALLDALVDDFFPILEHYGDELERIEGRIIADPSPDELRDLHEVKRDLTQLRRVMWPTRQLVDELRRSEFTLIDKDTRTYLRDIHDHALHVLDMVETYREMTNGLTDLYMTSVSNRMNEVMKVLTILASLFIPTTFLAGVYGMNFEHMPELGWAASYPVFWAVCLVTMGGLLYYFRRRNWL